MEVRIYIQITDVEEIRRMPTGHEFLVYNDTSKKMKTIVRKAEKEGLIEQIETGLGWDSNGEFGILEEKYRRR